MLHPKIKTLISTLVFILISILLLFIIYLKTYDQNYPVNIFVDKFFKKTQSKPVNLDKKLIINIEKNISSEKLLSLLNLLKYFQANKIIIDNQFNKLANKNKLNEINQMIANDSTIISVMTGEIRKGFNRISYYKKNPEIVKNFLFINSQNKFFFARLLSQKKLNPDIIFSAEKIGIMPSEIQYWDLSNIDLLYKIENQYILSLPFLLYLIETKQNIKSLEFGFFSLKLNPYQFFYDEKSRVSTGNQEYYEDTLEPISFSDWEKDFILRNDIIDQLSELNLFSQENNQPDFAAEENILSSIYEIEDLADSDQNAQLNLIKEQVKEWNSSKKTYQPLITNADIYIVTNGNYFWIKNILYQKNIIKSGNTLLRFPLILLFLVFALLASLIILLYGLNDSWVLKIFCQIGLLLLGVASYVGLRIYLRIDFPIVAFLLTMVCTTFLGIILLLIKKAVWSTSVYQIFGNTISMKYRKEIAGFWRKTQWKFDLKAITATFLMIDTSIFLRYSENEEDVETIDQDNMKIEQIIKKYDGVININNPKNIIVYFGVPPIKEEHTKEAVLAAEEINKIPVVLNQEEHVLPIAIHAKKEWFKLVKKHTQIGYDHFGTSLNILPALIKVARKFHVKVVISDNIYKLHKERLKVRMLDRIKVQGVERSIRLFELLMGEQESTVAPILDYFHAGLKLFESQSFEEASSYFRQCLKIVPDDIPAAIYLQRCKDFLYIPPLETWDGVFEVE
ncbi:MAG: hypothetical protein MJB14_01260 [Spirochaetes bacterium]|nr:hypothetical protein [Spirochaetota bacterium]